MKEQKRLTCRSFKTQIVKCLAATSLLAASIFAASAQEAVTNAVKPAWETSAALGLTLTRGNSDTLLFTGNILSAKKWDEHEVSLGADTTYGESEDVKNAETLHGFGQYNRLFTERAYGFVRLDGLHDAIADIEFRFTLSPGIGYYFIKEPKTTLSGEIGPGFVYEKQGRETRGYITLRLAERFEHKLNDRARIWQSLEILPQIDDYENFIANFELGIESALTEKLSLRAYIQDTYDNEPAPGRKRNDLKLVSALAYKF